ncbi:DNA-binding MarR family transcriptional regulator [Kribbella aluminosa]|uniref:DNA-binding MarR family transcriptional regulator n=1 Tax=Kribbella aluminosa TaxID=416017 RepID=A0ABS4UVQ9_9ACTN|nr:MarR family transcriptional regulator [Kribbella aluminosa]MBP2355735.1 DNA-binding MarR family transcriptional regulator [Kribbella aluminosa]
MPGGRLSHQDRLQIAEGLAGGLGYTEIARRLERPTSTISREVARNGGAGGYRADHAHYATAARARRRTGRENGAAGAGGPGGAGDPRRAFVERFAEMMVEGGLPRMASRVLALLYTSDSRTLTAAELVRDLQVSPASISKAIGYLEQVGMVHREPDPVRRLQHYVVADDVWFKAWEVSARTNNNWAETAAEGIALLGADTPAGQRLSHMADFFARLSEDMSGGAGFQDCLAVLAVLQERLDAEELAAALGWPVERVTDVLEYAAKSSGQDGAEQPAGEAAVRET